MRILFLSKRRYMGKDLLADRYGRFFELPEVLARRGNAITGVTILYGKAKREPHHELLTAAGMSWRSVGLIPRPLQALRQYRQLVDDTVSEFRPDVIVGASDAFHLIYASHLGIKHQIPVVVDMYDHFDAYAATWAPGIRRKMRKALLSVDGVTCVSKALVEWCTNLRGSTTGVYLLPNGVVPELFRPMDNFACRKELGLPQQKVLIGTAGALMASRDIKSLYRAFEMLRIDVPDAHLVIAGRRDVKPPQGNNVIDLGVLPHDKVPTLFSALDVGVVCNNDSLFARYCDPQKLAEMRASGIPVVVADTFGGTIQEEPTALWLYTPGNPASLAAQLRKAIHVKNKPLPPSGINWEDRGMALESFLRATIQRTRSSKQT